MAEDEKMKLYELQAEIIETQERLKELTVKERQLDSKVNNIPLNEESIVVSTDFKSFEVFLKAFDEQWSKRFSTMEDALQFQRVEMAALKEEQWQKEEKNKQINEQYLRDAACRGATRQKEREILKEQVKGLQTIIDKQSKSIETIRNDLTKIKEDQIKTGQLANTLQAKKDTKIQNKLSDLFKKQAAAEKKFSKIYDDLDYCLDQLAQDNETNQEEVEEEGQNIYVRMENVELKLSESKIETQLADLLKKQTETDNTINKIKKDLTNCSVKLSLGDERYKAGFKNTETLIAAVEKTVGGYQKELGNKHERIEKRFEVISSMAVFSLYKMITFSNKLESCQKKIFEKEDLNAVSMQNASRSCIQSFYLPWVLDRIKYVRTIIRLLPASELPKPILKCSINQISHNTVNGISWFSGNKKYTVPFLDFGPVYTMNSTSLFEKTVANWHQVPGKKVDFFAQTRFTLLSEGSFINTSLSFLSEDSRNVVGGNVFSSASIAEYNKPFPRWIILFSGLIYDIQHLIEENFSLYEKFLDDTMTVNLTKKEWKSVCRCFIGICSN